MARMVKMSFNVEAAEITRWRRIPDGIRGTVLRHVMGVVCDIYEKKGEAALGALLTGRIHIDIDRKSVIHSST